MNSSDFYCYSFYCTGSLADLPVMGFVIYKSEEVSDLARLWRGGLRKQLAP